MTRLTRDQILGHTGAVEVIDLPGLGGQVGVRMLSVAERDLFDRMIVETPRDQGVLRAELLARCLVGEDGARLFADGDAAVLKALPAAGLEPAVAVALRLNALRAEDLDVLGKDSAATPDAGSFSSSPSGSE